MLNNLNENKDNINQFIRTELLIGKQASNKLKKSHVAIFGVGGVGGFSAEALARSGVGEITLFDKDTVSITNINRQIIATHKTIGQAKTKLMKDRILEINPDALVQTHQVFYNSETADQFDLSKFDYIIDAIDTITSKLLLIEKAKQNNIPIISSMGAGNKLDPTAFEVCDIFKTSVCPMARVVRRELKKRNIKKLKVVYSKEIPIDPSCIDPVLYESVINSEQKDNEIKRRFPGSISFVPSVVGLIIAGEVVKDIIKDT